MTSYTLLKKEVHVVSTLTFPAGKYYIVKIRCTYRLTGNEKVTIEQLGSSSNSVMEAERFAIEALEKKYIVLV